MAKFNYFLAERDSLQTWVPIKGMYFKRFEAAQATGQHLADIHRGTEYLIIDMIHGTQFKIERKEKGGGK